MHAVFKDLIPVVSESQADCFHNRQQVVFPIYQFWLSCNRYGCQLCFPGTYKKEGVCTFTKIVQSNVNGPCVCVGVSSPVVLY